MNEDGSRLGIALGLAALCWLAAACQWQPDLVALHRAEPLCPDATLCGQQPPVEDAGSPPSDSPQCDAAEGCTQDAGCLDEDACGAPPPQMVQQCLVRGCQPLQDMDAFCMQAGSAFVLGDSCASADSNPGFHNALCSQSDLIVKAPLQVNGDVTVDRDLSLSDEVIVQGELQYTGMLLQTDGASVQASSQAQSPPSCDPAGDLRFDIEASVRARATDNDNAQAQDQVDLLQRWSGAQSITLPCGRYYLQTIDGGGSMDITATGNVALFIDGGASVTDGLQIHAADGARVSVIVNGNLHVIGGLKLGELSDARHLLVTRGQAYLEQGQNTIGGVLYVQSEELLLVDSTLDVQGAVFAYRAQLEGATRIVGVAAASEVLGTSCNPNAQ